MEQEEARRSLRRAGLEDDIYKLIEYSNSHYLMRNQTSIDKFKSIIEVISDGEYTIKLEVPQDRYGRYVVDIVENQIYTEYWS